MPTNDRLVNGVVDDNVLGGCGILPLIFKIETISFNDFVIVENFGVFFEMAFFYLHVIIATFAIDVVILPNNFSWAVQIGLVGFCIIIELSGVYSVFRIVYPNVRNKLVFLFFHKILPTITLQRRSTINYGSWGFVKGNIFDTIQKEGVCSQGHIGLF